MEYLESYQILKEALFSDQESIDLDKISIHKFSFKSEFQHLLPGSPSFKCENHKVDFEDTISYTNDIGPTDDEVHKKDYNVYENQNFNYYLLKPKGTQKIKKFIFMFHGLNEKTWEKYLPWGDYICDKTGSAIVFFPIAFHMDRAPLLWSEKRKMFALSEERKKKFPNIINSTLSNVAISMRLHTMPQRIIWSGLQTYYDVIQFIEEIKKENHPQFDANCTFDMFAYSIGGLLAEILKLSNHNNYFKDSKLCLFCAGAVMNRFSAVSKFILDSEANIALYSYLAEHFNSFLKKDTVLQHYIEEGHVEGKVFHSMLEFQRMRVFREELFKKNQHQIYAVALKKDYVIPSFEVINTLQGAFRDINIEVDEFDFPFDYSHENPFPLDKNQSKLINENFKLIFDKISHFFNI